jgi:hypothetical protein
MFINWNEKCETKGRRRKRIIRIRTSVSTSCYCDKILEKTNLKEETLWLLVSELSVHGHLVLLFLGQTLLGGCVVEQSCSPHGSQAAKGE